MRVMFLALDCICFKAQGHIIPLNLTMRNAFRLNNPVQNGSPVIKYRLCLFVKAKQRVQSLSVIRGEKLDANIRSQSVQYVGKRISSWLHTGIVLIRVMSTARLQSSHTETCKRFFSNISSARSPSSNSDCGTKLHADNKLKIISGNIVRWNHHGEQNIPKPETITCVPNTNPPCKQREECSVTASR